MAVQVAQPGQRRQRRDFLDLLLGGLQAASAFTNIRRAQAEMEAIPEAQARARRMEERQFAAQFQQAPEGVPGAVELEAPTGERGLFVPRAQVMAGKQLQAAGGERRRKIGEQTFKQLGEVRKNLTSNKDFQKAASKVLDSTTLVGLAEKAKLGNQPAFEQMKVIIARMNQGGVLTDRDLDTLGGSQQYGDVASRFLSQKVVGDVRPEDIDDLLEVAKAARDSGLDVAKSIRRNTLNNELKRFIASGIEMDRKTLESVTEINDLIEISLVEIPERTTPRRSLIPESGKKKRSLDEQLKEFKTFILK